MYEYRGDILRVIDGDTVVARVDLGCEVGITLILRLEGINAPELNTEEGKAAKAALESLLWGQPEMGGKALIYQPVTIITVKDRRERYGRYRATIFLEGEAVSVNERMVEDGHARRWV